MGCNVFSKKEHMLIASVLAIQGKGWHCPESTSWTGLWPVPLISFDETAECLLIELLNHIFFSANRAVPVLLRLQPAWSYRIRRKRVVDQG